jgi:hypothetical protein
MIEKGSRTERTYRRSSQRVEDGNFERDLNERVVGAVGNEVGRVGRYEVDLRSSTVRGIKDEGGVSGGRGEDEGGNPLAFVRPEKRALRGGNEGGKGSAICQEKVTLGRQGRTVTSMYPAVPSDIQSRLALMGRPDRERRVRL